MFILILRLMWPNCKIKTYKGWAVEVFRKPDSDEFRTKWRWFRTEPALISIWESPEGQDSHYRADSGKNTSWEEAKSVSYFYITVSGKQIYRLDRRSATWTSIKFKTQSVYMVRGEFRMHSNLQLAEKKGPWFHLLERKEVICHPFKSILSDV